MTNKKDLNNEVFQNCCIKANCKPTTRQLSKFKRGLGIVYKVITRKAEPLRPGQPGYFHEEKEGD